MPIRTNMHVAVVRKVFEELRSIDELERRDLQGAVGEDRVVQVEDGQDVRSNVGDDHVGDEDSESQGSERQIQTAEAQSRQGDEATHNRRRGHTEGETPECDPLGEPRSGEADVEDDDGGDRSERHRCQVDLPGVSGQQGQ